MHEYSVQICIDVGGTPSFTKGSSDCLSPRQGKMGGIPGPGLMAVDGGGRRQGARSRREAKSR